MLQCEAGELQELPQTAPRTCPTRLRPTKGVAFIDRFANAWRHATACPKEAALAAILPQEVAVQSPVQNHSTISRNSEGAVGKLNRNHGTGTKQECRGAGSMRQRQQQQTGCACA